MATKPAGKSAKKGARATAPGRLGHQKTSSKKDERTKARRALMDRGGELPNNEFLALLRLLDDSRAVEHVAPRSVKLSNAVRAVIVHFRGAHRRELDLPAKLWSSGERKKALQRLIHLHDRARENVGALREAWKIALQFADRPTVFALSRESLSREDVDKLLAKALGPITRLARIAQAAADEHKPGGHSGIAVQDEAVLQLLAWCHRFGVEPSDEAIERFCELIGYPDADAATIKRRLQRKQIRFGPLRAAEYDREDLERGANGLFERNRKAREKAKRRMAHAAAAKGDGSERAPKRKGGAEKPRG